MWIHIHFIFALGLINILLIPISHGSCWRYGHSCWGGHGKRAGDPPPGDHSNPPIIQSRIPATPLDPDPLLSPASREWAEEPSREGVETMRRDGNEIIFNQNLIEPEVGLSSEEVRDLDLDRGEAEIDFEPIPGRQRERSHPGVIFFRIFR